MLPEKCYLHTAVCPSHTTSTGGFLSKTFYSYIPVAHTFCSVNPLLYSSYGKLRSNSEMK